MKKKLAIILITAMTVAGMTTGCGNKLALTDDSFTLELGDNPENHTASYVDVKDEKELNKISFDFSKVDTMKVGEYEAAASIGKTKKTFHIDVEDTTAPKAAAKAEIKTGVNMPVYAEDMIDSITELSGKVSVTFKDHAYTGEDPEEAEKKADDAKDSEATEAAESTEKAESTKKAEDTEAAKQTEESTQKAASDGAKEVVTPEIERTAVSYDAAGEYDNTMVLSDASGNKSNVDVHIVVSNLPVINGATDMLVEKGASVDYMNGVSAVDGAGNDITAGVTVDSSKVDVNTPGDYEVTYTAVDADGLTSTATVKVTVAENIEETVNNTDTADGSASEKRVTTSSGTGKATDKKNEMNQKHVEEQQAAAEASAQAGNNSNGNGSSSSGKKNKNSASNTGNGGSSAGGASSSSGNSGGSSAPAQETPSQPSAPAQESTPSQGPAVCDKGSATNGALNGDQKAHVDALVNQWRTSGGDDNTYSDMIGQYLLEQGIDCSYGGCESSRFLTGSWEEACSRQRESGGVYNSMYLSTNGEYQNGDLVCYFWQVDIY